MIQKSDIIADFHTHTVFSLHALSTIRENIESAARAGMKYMVTSDHYYNVGSEVEKKNETNRILYTAQRANTNRQGVVVIGSAECNLEQDMRPVFEQKLKDNVIKYRPIGLHSWFLPRAERTLDDIFSDFKYAHEHFNFNVFVHIEREIDQIDGKKYGHAMNSEIERFFDKMVQYAKDNDVFLEVNESSLVIDGCGNRERLTYWLTKARDNGNRIVLGTDAHYCDEVGQFNNVIELLNELNYPKELIVNCNEDQIQQFI